MLSKNSKCDRKRPPKNSARKSIAAQSKIQKIIYFELIRRGVIYYAVIFTPEIIVLELIMWGNSAACYVEKPRLGASGVKMTPENLIEINFQRGNFKIAPHFLN